MSIKFSVVMATYAGDCANHLLEAGRSVFEQSIPPNELLLVIDGPIGRANKSAIDSISKLGNVKILQLEVNVGVGMARHQGIVGSKYDLIAIMDSDDVCDPRRFERQLLVFETKSVDVVGGWIIEFSDDYDDIVKKTPKTQSEIFKYAKSRNPMNNVTVMLKKEAYLSVDGFKDLRVFEDYDLYVRMLLNGSNFYNLQEVLVFVRVGQEMLKRRGGLNYALEEIKIQVEFLRVGFITMPIFIKNVCIRFPVRILPNKVRRFVYKMIRN